MKNGFSPKIAQRKCEEARKLAAGKADCRERSLIESQIFETRQTLGRIALVQQSNTLRRRGPADTTLKVNWRTISAASAVR
ncbi:hypothetical protein [Comamonas odontotermitis]|uniref:hypothetical protein n=1 Tax=Comamonas odontotermitis TaxID=379895 RepID=UPI001618BED5|nr:hypothetical protein [Comamonas odontotermitis]